MATKLGLFNSALLIAGERKLSSLTEEREPRRMLDLVWDEGNAVDYCLEQGQWFFATRAVKISYDAASSITFGFTRKISMPSDHIRTVGICSDEYFTTRVPYSVERDSWFCDLDDIYVRYVSNDASYGNDLSLWPATFSEYVAAFLCSRIIHKLNPDQKERDKVYALAKSRLEDAKVKDALGKDVTFMPAGSWVRSRRGGVRSRRDANGNWSF